MCTIGFCRDLNIVFKNRDKDKLVEEEIIADDNIIACRTVGADYYSWGINRYGCAFVSAAINTPKWTQLHYNGKTIEANEQYELENIGLDSPMQLISNILPSVKRVDMWIETINVSKRIWKGYNILIADSQNAYIIELYKDQYNIREIGDREVITNHFQIIDHGPKNESDYENSFQRLTYGKEKIEKVKSTGDIFQMLKPDNPEDQKKIWRSDEFSTVSSTIINFQDCHVYYSKKIDEKYIKKYLSNRGKEEQ